jgi:hypothetical protein
MRQVAGARHAIPSIFDRIISTGNWHPQYGQATMRVRFGAGEAVRSNAGTRGASHLFGEATRTRQPQDISLRPDKAIELP